MTHCWPQASANTAACEPESVSDALMADEHCCRAVQVSASACTRSSKLCIGEGRDCRHSRCGILDIHVKKLDRQLSVRRARSDQVTAWHSLQAVLLSYLPSHCCWSKKPQIVPAVLAHDTLRFLKQTARDRMC